MRMRKASVMGQNEGVRQLWVRAALPVAPRPHQLLTRSPGARQTLVHPHMGQ
jgi:hypothetical protein